MDELVEMACPYPDTLCDAPASFKPHWSRSIEGLAGQITCANGHRWNVMLAEHPEENRPD